MIVEVWGTAFGNKGAELMLAAIQARLAQSAPTARIAARPGIGSYERRARRGLLQVLDARDVGRAGRIIEWLMHAGYRRRYGLVAPHEVDVVWDGSGYALGDPWKPEWIEQRANDCERMRSLGKPIVLLPQAMGPFRNKRVSAASRRVLTAARLAFARDPESLAAAKELLPDAVNLHMAPDFTNLLEGQLPPEFQGRERMVALIPNQQMVTHGDEATRRRYVPFLAEAARRIQAAGYDPMVLLHEDKADRHLAEMIASAADCGMEVVSEPDPVVLKGIIGRCAFTIGSRFHGLVSALSQGVPSMGTSWSHKYRHLFADYSCSEYLIDPSGDWDCAWAALDTLMHEPTRDGLGARLRDCARSEKERSRSMWHEVEALSVASVL